MLSRVLRVGVVEHFLGIDVGYSRTRKSTGLCLLNVDGGVVSWDLLNVGTEEHMRMNNLRSLIPRGSVLEGVAIDGPLVSGLNLVNHYRTSDALLSRGAFRFRGKPGQTNIPSGQLLHKHATKLAKLVVGMETEGYLSISRSTHNNPVKSQRILEAFPNVFLAVLLNDAEFPVLNRDASDRFWEIAVNQRYLDMLLEILVPGAVIESTWAEVVNHDHRAALVCALAALAVSKNRYVAIGDPVDGDVFLPPVETWGSGNMEEPWAQVELHRNVKIVRQNKGNHPNHEKARLILDGRSWE